MQHNITSTTALSWSTSPTCRVCKRTFHPPEVGRPQVYCSQACRQSAYRARTTSRQARVAAAELRRMLSSLNDDFANRSGNLAAAIGAIDGRSASGASELPTGWETQVSRTARDLREMLDRIEHLVIDHSQLAYRHRTATKRLGPVMRASTSTETSSPEHSRSRNSKGAATPTGSAPTDLITTTEPATAPVPSTFDSLDPATRAALGT